MTKAVYVAVDIGASGGRHVAGMLDGDRLTIEEVHRFENRPVLNNGQLQWNLPALWNDVQAGLRAAASRFGDRVRSVGVDTWGLDFGLLDRHGHVLSNPVSYRDSRTDGMVGQACSIVPRDEIFAETGLQFMQINTLYQLLALRRQQPDMLARADALLLMPDLFHWLLTGEKRNELTNATTTQFFNPRRREWSAQLLARLELPARILQPLIAPGTTVGPLRDDVAETTGLKSSKVVAPATHDTASAVAAVPATLGGEKPNWCYISSGTWSLVGVELPQPIINDRCLALNFTNEGGVEGTTRLLKNICGLWLIQECRRAWQADGTELSWATLMQEADAAAPLVSLIDPNDPRFLHPPNMPAAIRAACHESGQPVPKSRGAVIRCALESIALKYRRVLGWLEELIGGRIETIHIVGGGAQNNLLCQMTADACNRRVIAGPVEATAIGNIGVQAIAKGAFESIAQLRRAVQRSFTLDEYLPQHPDAWQEVLHAL